jgi:sulfur carrier protein
VRRSSSATSRTGEHNRSCCGDDGAVPVKVLLRNPRREVDVAGPLRVLALLDRLGISRETVLVIRGDTLVPGDTLLEDGDTVEVRPVISGGAA